MRFTAFTQHALDRYQKRIGVVRTQRAMEKLLDIANRAIPIGSGKYYHPSHHGIVIVGREGLIQTVYRPHSPEVKRAIFKACQSAAGPADAAPEAAALEECDLCHDKFGLSQLELTGNQMLCAKCRQDRACP